jgi:hypothetical protein
MCSIELAGLALGAASAGAQAIGAQQQARMQYQAQMQQIAMQRRLQEQTAAAETRRSLRQMTGERLQQQQQERMISEEERQEILKAEAAIARTAEDPVTAVAKQREYFALLGQKKFALGEQLEMLQAGKTLALEDQGLGLQQRLMGIRQPIMDPIKPRGLGITDVLSVASGGLRGYQMGQQLSGGMGGVDTSIDVPKGPVRFGGKVYDYQKLA